MAVEFQSQHKIAYDRLVQLIVRGVISADEPLSERKLSHALQMGRTPIREALSALAPRGMQVLCLEGKHERNKAD